MYGEPAYVEVQLWQVDVTEVIVYVHNFYSFVYNIFQVSYVLWLSVLIGYFNVPSWLHMYYD